MIANGMGMFRAEWANMARMVTEVVRNEQRMGGSDSATANQGTRLTLKPSYID
jgi:hypothetical protein